MAFSDALSGILPGRRFITIHPELLAIMGYHEAALLHEIRWRAAATVDGWVRIEPSEWEESLHLTPKQVRRAQDVCIEAGWIEVDYRGDTWDRCRSYRLVVGAIASALEGECISPGGQLSSALEGTSSYLKESLQEVPGANALEGQTANQQPRRLEQTLRMFDRDGTEVTAEMFARMPNWARAGLEGLPTPPVATDLPTGMTAEDAPSTPGSPSDHWRVKRPDKVLKLLQPHGVVVGSRQADQRALAKLADLGPTRSQIDGACNTLLATEGRVDIGRLVAKWDMLSQFAAPRPAAWNTKRVLEKDAIEAHEAAGGSRYDRDGAVDYGL